jgi:hypothetical protein
VHSSRAHEEWALVPNPQTNNERIHVDPNALHVVVVHIPRGSHGHTQWSRLKFVAAL